MNIYKNKEDNKLYTLEELIIDIYYADCGGRLGIYCYDYPRGKKAKITFISRSKEERKQLVEDNFIKIGEAL